MLGIGPLVVIRDEQIARSGNQAKEAAFADPQHCR